MNSHCCHANSEQRMARMQRQLELAASIAEIERINAHEKAKEKKKKQVLHGEIAPAAQKKTLEANSNDASKLTVKEMDAIAYTYFMNAVLKGKKPEKVRGLQTLIRTHSDVMPRALAAITDNAAGSDEYDDLPLSRQHSNMHWMQSPQMIQMMTCPGASLQPLLHCNVQIKTLMQRSSQPAVTILTRITTRSRWCVYFFPSRSYRQARALR